MAETQVLQNVLRDDQRLPRVPEPAVMVIFGASGDLTRRKLIPALYDLAAQRRLPMELAVVGISRTEMSHEEFRARLHDALKEQRPGRVSEDVWESFSRGISLPPRRLEEARDLRGAQELLEAARRGAGPRGTGSTTPLPLALPDDRREARGGGDEQGRTAATPGSWSRSRSGGT